jgi:SAM-dependent methyltransferase
VLGSDEPEIARLDAQAAVIAQPTELLLRAMGLRPGMRVLDLGSGLGHVAFAVAELVGPTGSVVGVDQAASILAIAERRRRAAGLANVMFREDDVRTFASDEPFDAVIGRLILFHLPDALEVVRHHARSVAPGGLLAAIDFDMGTARAEPPVALVSTALGWILKAFRAAGANPVIGARLGAILTEAGLHDVTTFGIQRYLPSDDPVGPALIGGVVRSLALKIVAEGIATEAELALESLPRQLTEAIRAANAVVVPPDVVGAWGHPAHG